jgi:hypothetical protein
VPGCANLFNFRAIGISKNDICVFAMIELTDKICRPESKLAEFKNQKAILKQFGEDGLKVYRALEGKSTLGEICQSHGFTPEFALGVARWLEEREMVRKAAEPAAAPKIKDEVLTIAVHRNRLLNLFILGLGVLSLTSIIFALDAFVHEGGHILGCAADSAVFGTHGGCSVTGTQKMSALDVPNKVTGTEGMFFAIGGPVASIFAAFLITRLGFFRNYKIARMMLLGGIMLFEIGGNMVCGTDHLSGALDNICPGSLKNTIFAISFIMVFAAIGDILYMKSKDEQESGATA